MLDQAEHARLAWEWDLRCRLEAKRREKKRLKKHWKKYFAELDKRALIRRQQEFWVGVAGQFDTSPGGITYVPPPEEQVN